MVRSVAIAMLALCCKSVRRCGQPLYGLILQCLPSHAWYGITPQHWCPVRAGGQSSWGLSSEAAFFADLDDQELAEESGRSKSPVRSHCGKLWVTKLS